MMADRFATLQGVVSRNYRPCFNVAHSCTLRNTSGTLLYNPLGCNPRTSKLLLVKVKVGPLELYKNAEKPRGPRCAAASDSSSDPTQSSTAAEEVHDNLVEEKRNAKNPVISAIRFAASLVSVVGKNDSGDAEQKEKKKRNRKGERTVYLLAAIISSIGFTALTAGAVYYRFLWLMQGASQVPYLEILGTFSLAIGAAVGMEYWARWAHKALWHASLWNMHESHHKPREGPFELNDVFAIINAVPAIALMAYGFFHRGIVPGLCFGAGLGITMFGMAYMFVHDGLVHRRFPVGPIADVPYLQKVAAAHQLHHADLFGGLPYGLFLGPQELENVGGEEELQKVLIAKYKVRKA